MQAHRHAHMHCIARAQVIAPAVQELHHGLLRQSELLIVAKRHLSMMTGEEAQLGVCGGTALRTWSPPTRTVNDEWVVSSSEPLLQATNLTSSEGSFRPHALLSCDVAVATELGARLRPGAA